MLYLKRFDLQLITWQIKGRWILGRVILEDHNWNGHCLKLSKKLWEEKNTKLSNGFMNLGELCIIWNVFLSHLLK